MHVDKREIRLEPTKGAQLPRADPRRGCLETRPERVDVDVRQLLRLVGFLLRVDRVAGVVANDPGRTVRANISTMDELFLPAPGILVIAYCCWQLLCHHC